MSTFRASPLRPPASFQSRITAAAMVTAVAVLLGASLAFALDEWRHEREHVYEQNRLIVRIIGAGDTVKPAFQSPAAAHGIARRVTRLLPPGAGAYFEDAQGRLIGGSGPTTPADAARAGLTEWAEPVVIDGQPVGRLRIFVAMPTLAAILPRYLALVGALLIAATALSLLLGRWLAARVTRPVERLSAAMRTVADSGDFTRFVEHDGDDDLGRLTDAFNDLLIQLNTNDRALRRTLEELVEARDAADAANRLKSHFLANMSHEIRTPLNGLLAMSQVMAMGRLDAEQRERLEVITHSGEALLAILNDVLDVSKIEAGKLELELAEFDAESIVRCALAPFGPVADERGLSLEFEVEPRARGYFRGDPARLRQIGTNLVSNAIKFTREGSVRIALRGDDADGLKIEVADTGIGIADDVLPQLFQKFTQADSSTTRRFGGTGLGLAICHDLAELMGGRIWVESAVGRGSTFHVLLPLPRVEHAPAGPAAREPEVVPAAPAVLPKVLAAEDNLTNQLVLKTIMAIFNIELTIVDNGRLAVDAWRGGGYDLILMDIQMPEMDGLTATRAIRAAEAAEGRARIPIVALSAHAMTHQVKEYLDAGVDLHVPKPIELPRLQAALGAAMAGDYPAARAAA